MRYESKDERKIVYIILCIKLNNRNFKDFLYFLRKNKKIVAIIIYVCYNTLGSNL